MSHRSRGGFTLVELLVVIVIIGMLVALLVPAVISARERARQAKCNNQQKELGLAVLQFETSKGRFPGYVNLFGTKSGPLSWVAMVFADLGRADLWREVRAGNIPNVQVEQLACPSDLEREGEPARLSYVANCGRAGSYANDAALGVFNDHSLPIGEQVRISASDIRDGTQQTLMLSEHVTAGRWTDIDEEKVGFLWNLTGSALPFEPGPGKASSNHPGGVIVTFCDGHTRFLNDDIAYDVYVHLMTPDSAASGYANFQSSVLNEGDY